MTQQTTVFGDPLETQVELEALGRVIRPWKRAIGQVVDEFRLHCEADQLRVSAVDSANVIATTLTLKSNALEQYRVEDPPVELGMTPEYLGSALQHVRYGKGSDDVVLLWANDAHLESETKRTFGDTDATLTERVPVIDEKSVREDFDNPDLDFTESVTIDPEAFTHAVGMMETGKSHHVTVSARDSGMALSQTIDGGVVQRDIELDCDTASDAESMFTADYLEDMASVLNVSYADTAQFKWSDEFPLWVDFERDGVYSGAVMVAPRIQSDGP